MLLIPSCYHYFVTKRLRLCYDGFTTLVLLCYHSFVTTLFPNCYYFVTVLLHFTILLPLFFIRLLSHCYRLDTTLSFVTTTLLPFLVTLCHHFDSTWLPHFLCYFLLPLFLHQLFTTSLPRCYHIATTLPFRYHLFITIALPQYYHFVADLLKLLNQSFIITLLPHCYNFVTIFVHFTTLLALC